MTRHPFSLLGIAFLVVVALAPRVQADLFAPGATLQVTYTDPATSSQNTETVAFNPGGAPASLDSGALQISEQTLVVNSTTEWVQFNLQTTSGGPLDTQSGGSFLVSFNNVNLTESAQWISNFDAFTYNGTTSGDPFFLPLVTDPVTPSTGWWVLMDPIQIQRRGYLTARCSSPIHPPRSTKTRLPMEVISANGESMPTRTASWAGWNCKHRNPSPSRRCPNHPRWRSSPSACSA